MSDDQKQRIIREISRKAPEGSVEFDTLSFLLENTDEMRFTQSDMDQVLSELDQPSNQFRASDLAERGLIKVIEEKRGNKPAVYGFIIPSDEELVAEQVSKQGIQSSPVQSFPIQSTPMPSIEIQHPITPSSPLRDTIAQGLEEISVIDHSLIALQSEKHTIEIRAQEDKARIDAQMQELVGKRIVRKEELKQHIDKM